MSIVRMARRSPVLLGLGGSLLALGLAIAWWLGSPLFVRSSLVEPPATLGQPVARGEFNQIDALHRGAGFAVIARDGSGTPTLRFEQFSVTNGPDLYVYLARSASPRSSSEVVDGGLEVGRLKAPAGEFGYDLAADLNLGEYRSVVVYCKAFSTIFSVATLAET